MASNENEFIQFVLQNRPRFGLSDPESQNQDEFNQFVSSNPTLFGINPEPTPRGEGALEAFMEGDVRSARERMFGSLEVLRQGAVDTGILQPVQGLLELPGDINPDAFGGNFVTERLAKFVEDMRQGTLERSEEFALENGVSPEMIARGRIAGNIIGFVAPVMGTLKLSSLLLRTPVAVQRGFSAGTLVQESLAGAIFGGLLLPTEGDDQQVMRERLNHALREGALFPIGRIIWQGAMLPFTGYRRMRSHKIGAEREVDRILQAVEEGKPVYVEDPKGSIPLSRLLSEEESIAHSVAAQDLLAKHGDETAFVASILGAARGGSSSGIVRQVGTDFPEVVQLLNKFRSEFPSLKFDAVRRGGQYDVYFGTKGLSNAQKRQLKAEGRFEGLKVEKNGAVYEYVGKGNEGKIKVRTSDGKLTQIEESGVTDLPEALEIDIAPMEGLYKQFSNSLEEGIDDLRSVMGGGLTEAEVIQGIREGTLEISDDAVRWMTLGSVITHPSEVGVAGASAEEFAQRFMQEGIESGSGYVPQNPTLSFDDLVDAWARKNNLPDDAADYQAMKSYFAQRAREDFWAAVPEEDRAVFNRLRDEFDELVRDRKIPFEAAAHNKGFSVERDPDGTVTLKDLLTGRDIRFGSEQTARDALVGIVRSEGDVLGAMIPNSTHGIGAMTGGFDPTDGVFTFNRESPSRSLLRDYQTGPIFSNTRDWLERIERETGIPVFTQGFNQVDAGLTAMREFVEPWAKKIDDAYSGLTHGEKVQIGEFWASVEGSGMSLADAVKQAKKAGLSTKQITAFTKSRNIFEALYELNPELKGSGRYINLYYSRIQPYFQKGGTGSMEDIFGPQVPGEYQFWAEMARTGDLAMVEKNPEIVMHKYVRGLGFKQNVAEHFDRLARIAKTKTTVKVRDLPKEQIAQLRSQKPTELSMKEWMNSPVLPQPVRNTIAEYLNIVRGGIQSPSETFNRFFSQKLANLGIKVDERVIGEYANAAISTMYGAAMALRPALTARNSTQTVWTLYTRLGGRHAGASLERAMTQEGFDEVMASRAIRNVSAGVPFGDAIFENMLEHAPIEGTGAISKAVAGAMRAALRTGQLSTRTARKFLIPYSSVDDMNRAWSYFWQKNHTAEAIAKYEAGKIPWQKVLDDGLPFFSPTVKKRFGDLYNRMGREQALRWIGKEAADESQWIYGVGAQPAWMQNTVGRFLGMFGTWPLWAWELYSRRFFHGTKKQRAAFVTRNLALTAAFTNMTLQSGIAMWNWIAPASMFSWSGGPFVDHVIQLRDVIEAPVDQKAQALGTLGKNVARLSFPGQIFYNDVSRALNAESATEATLMLFLGRPVDDYHTALEFQYDPAVWQEALEREREAVPLGAIPRVPLTGGMTPLSQGPSQGPPGIPLSNRDFTGDIR